MSGEDGPVSISLYLLTDLKTKHLQYAIFNDFNR